VEDLESIIMELLVNAGSARSQALTALQLKPLPTAGGSWTGTISL